MNTTSTPTSPASTILTTTPGGPATPQTERHGRRSASAGSPPRLTLRRVIRSEWIKVWSIRSTMVTLVAVIAVTVGFGLIAAAVSSGSVTPSSAQGGPPSGAFGNSSPVSTVLTGSNFAVLIVAVLGALIGAREYSSGMIRTTITTVPRRLTVLWAKTVTLVGALLPAALIGVLGAFFAGMAILSNAGAATASLSDTGTARAVFGMVAYIVGIGVMGLAFGFLFRSIATSIATLIGGVMILPTFAGLLLPASWSSLLKYLPANAGEAFTQVTHTSTTLTPAAGAAVFATWVIAAVALAAATLRHRDV